MKLILKKQDRNGKIIYSNTNFFIKILVNIILYQKTLILSNNMQN